MNDELIGIAFQSYKQKDLEKAGYVVPIPIIRHLFDDLDDGAITGVPDLGIYWQKIENASLREFAGLTGARTGVLITRVVHGSSADGLLHEGDVLTAIDGVPVASDGSILLRAHDRVHFSYLVSRRQVGDHTTVEILRHGEQQRLAIALRKLVTLVAPPQPGLRPSYFIFAGLVFLPLTYDYMATWKWDNVAPRFKHYYYSRLPSERHEQIVLVNQVLAHDINVGYHQIHGAVVERINGIDILAMRDVPRALETPVGKFHIIELDYHGTRGESSDYHASYGTRIVLDASAAAQATLDILAQNGIASDRSADLR
jgi:hypothetical protein